MGVEIEKKARVKDFDKTKEKLLSMFGVPFPIDKSDFMFKTNGTNWRIRKYSDGAYEFNHKNKVIKGDTEVNEEIESTLFDKEGFDGNSFFVFLKSIGVEPYYTKHKWGVSFHTPRIIGKDVVVDYHIELVNVSSDNGYCDDFLEIEYTGKLKEVTEEDVISGLNELFEEIGETDFEDKKYVDLILGEKHE